MRFLVDNALSPLVADRLRDAGHDAAHVRDFGIQASDDSVVMARAERESRVLVSADTDFGTILALEGKEAPSVIIFRLSIPRRPSAQAALIQANLANVAKALEKGAVVILEDERVRVRPLPIGDVEEEDDAGTL